MGWLIALGILLVLAALPLGIRLHYDTGGPVAKVIAGPVKLTVFPSRKKKKKETSGDPAPKPGEKPRTVREEPLPQPPQPPAGKDGQEKKGGSLTDFLPLIKLAFSFLGDFRRKLRVNDLQFKIILAGSDPCDLAVNYGKTCAAVANLLPRLESWFVIKKRNVAVECDFTAGETLVYAHLDLTVTLGRLLSLLVGYGIRVLTEFLKIQKKRKGGAVT